MSDQIFTDFDAASFEIIDGDRGKNYPQQNELSDSGYCLFLNANNVTRSGFEFSECQFITEQKDEVLRKGKLQRDDVVLTTRGTIGNTAYFNASVPFEQMRINSGMVILRCNSEKVSPAYLYHFLRSPSFYGQVNSLRSGVAQPQLPIRDMKRIKMPLPPFPEQQRIASILSAYDNLIENNRRRIQLLEQAARLLYKEWFIHLRFPGHEHTPITNGIPAGWERVPFPNVVDFKEGPGLRNHQYRDEGIPFLNIRTFNNDEIDRSKTRCIDETEVISKYQHFLLEEDDHVVSSSGTLGRLVTVRECHLPVMLNTSLIRMRPKGAMRKWFLKAYLKYGDFIDQARSMATGAAQLNYGPSHLKAMSLVIPNPRLVELFEEHVGPHYKQIKGLLDSNLQLAQARDLLLPRLMNGEMRV